MNQFLQYKGELTQIVVYLAINDAIDEILFHHFLDAIEEAVDTDELNEISNEIDKYDSLDARNLERELLSL